SSASFEASRCAGPYQGSPDPVVFCTSHGSLFWTPTRSTPEALMSSTRLETPGSGAGGSSCARARVGASSPPTASTPASSKDLSFVILVLPHHDGSLIRCEISHAPGRRLGDQAEAHGFERMRLRHRGLR